MSPLISDLSALQDQYWAVLITLAIFGFFGLGTFPLILELAVEVRWSC